MDIVFKFIQWQHLPQATAAAHRGVPFILLLNIWREHYIRMLFGDKWNETRFIRI